MSLSGVRGTLKHQYTYTPLNFNFYGKTGTLTGIRSLSGYFMTPYGVKIVSIIHTSTDYNPNNFINVLKAIYTNSSCNG